MDETSNNIVRNQYLPDPDESWAQIHGTPEDFLHESFQSIEIEPSIREITAELKAEPGKRVTCAYCFRLPTYDAIKAQAWLSAKQIQCAKFDPPKDTTYRQITASGVSLTGQGFRLKAAAVGLPKLDILVYTGGLVQPEGWDIPIVVDLAGLQIPEQQTPVLFNHDPDQVVGHGVAINSGQNLRLKGVVSAVGPAARQVVEAAKNGFDWKSSIGCDRLADAKLIKPGATIQCNGKTFDGPCYYWPTSILREVTITGRGADPNSIVNLAAKARRLAASSQGVRKMDEQFESWVKALGLDPEKLEETQKTTLQDAYGALHADAAKKGDEGGEEEIAKKMAARARKVYAAETGRLDAINKGYRSLCAKWCLDSSDHVDKRKRADELRAKAADLDWTADKIELEFLRLGYPENVISGTRGNSNDIDAKVLECAALRSLMMHEDKLTKYFKPEVLEASARPEMRGIGLKALLAIGGRPRGFTPPFGSWQESDIRDALVCAYPSPHTLRAEASTFQLPGILSNLANKYLYEGFWMVDDSWSKISSKRPAPDFKPVPGFRLFGNLTFEKIGKNGEIPHGDVGELVYVNAAQTYAKGIVTTRQDIRNDDLSALSRIPQLIGMGAAYALNHEFWTVFLAGKDSQGGTVFATTHTTAGNTGNSNYQNGSTVANGVTQTTSALSTTSLAKCRQLFREQVKPDGEPLGFPPKVLLVPPALETMAEQIYKSVELRQVMQGAGNASGAVAANMLEVQTTNIFKGQFEPVVCPYIGATDYPSGATAGSDAAWYLMADPAQLGLMEIVFLDGQQIPTVQSSEANFDILGIAHRGFFDFGVKMIEYRAAVKASGA